MSPPFILYRLSAAVHKFGLKRTATGISWLNRMIFSCWLPGAAVIGRGTRVGYWGIGVVLHHDVVIGEDCLIGQNVTIGRNFRHTRVPRLGDRVYVGTGSVVFGEITIGDNAVVGANSVVNRNVPANAIVAGNPARIIGNTGGKWYRELDEEPAHSLVEKF